MVTDPDMCSESFYPIYLNGSLRILFSFFFTQIMGLWAEGVTYFVKVQQDNL